jgi:hypothetical protein
MAWLVMLALAVYSVVFWVGRPAFVRRALPRWIDDDGLIGLQTRAITVCSIWFTGGFLLLVASARADSIDLLLVPAIALFVLGYASAGWMRPKWAIPDWFRKRSSPR